jgi:hypothetical protein
VVQELLPGKNKVLSSKPSITKKKKKKKRREEKGKNQRGLGRLTNRAWLTLN